MMNYIKIIVLIILVSGCATRKKLAPVEYYNSNKEVKKNSDHVMNERKHQAEIQAIPDNKNEFIENKSKDKIYNEEEDSEITLGETVDSYKNEHEENRKKSIISEHEKLKRKLLEKHKEEKRKEFIMPIQGGKIITKFYDKNDMGEPNKGINILAPKGTKILASSDGVVRYSEYGTVFGNLLIIELDQKGIVTIYGHLDEFAVNKGAKVRQGDVIGYVGKTGSVSEPQLYFAIREGKKPKDPLELIE